MRILYIVKQILSYIYNVKNKKLDFLIYTEFNMHSHSLFMNTYGDKLFIENSGKVLPISLTRRFSSWWKVVNL